MNYDFYNILITPSDSYFNKTLVVILSVILNCKKPSHFYIMQSDWTEEHKRVCTDFVAEHQGNTAEYIDTDDKDFLDLGFPAYKDHYEPYYKLLAHRLPDSVERVLYFDVDMLIRKDLEKFYSMNLGDNYFCSSVPPMFTQRKYSDYENIEQKGGIWPNYFLVAVC